MVLAFIFPQGSVEADGSGNGGTEQPGGPPELWHSVCHFPPGNIDQAHVIHISESAWRSSEHPGHGDYIIMSLPADQKDQLEPKQGTSCAPTPTEVPTLEPTPTTVPTEEPTPTEVSEPQPVWDSVLNCDILKVSVLINETFQEPVKVDGWIFADGEELLYWSEVVTPSPSSWFNTGMDTPANFVGEVTGRIVVSQNGSVIANHDFGPASLNCSVPNECVIDGLGGFLNYSGNHLSNLPVTGEVYNPSADSCADTAYIHVFGSMQSVPEGPGWLESQVHVASFAIDVPEGNQHVSISQNFDQSGYCWYQVDLVPVADVRVPPYYSGGDMIDYVFIEGNCNGEPTPTQPVGPTSTPKPGVETGGMPSVPPSVPLFNGTLMSLAIAMAIIGGAFRIKARAR